MRTPLGSREAASFDQRGFAGAALRPPGFAGFRDKAQGSTGPFCTILVLGNPTFSNETRQLEWAGEFRRWKVVAARR
jgi:hypothetical protein